MPAQAVPASVFLRADFRAVGGAHFDHFDPGIVRASADGLGEAGVRKRRQHPLPAGRRVRQLRFLFGEVEKLDRDRLLRLARGRDNLCNRRLIAVCVACFDSPAVTIATSWLAMMLPNRSVSLTDTNPTLKSTPIAPRRTSEQVGVSMTAVDTNTRQPSSSRRKRYDIACLALSAARMCSTP
jgi:hypothetical protein